MGSSCPWITVLLGDVVLEAKTTALAKHYERDFGAVPLPVFGSSVPRYLIADEAARVIKKATIF